MNNGHFRLVNIYFGFQNVQDCNLILRLQWEVMYFFNYFSYLMRLAKSVIRLTTIMLL